MSTPQFTHDWISHTHPVWEQLIPEDWLGKPVSFLEIGCYEGLSTLWFLQRFPQGHATCIDTFEGGQDHKELGLDFGGSKRRFGDNIEPYADRVQLLAKPSRCALNELYFHRYNLILVDGSHLALDVLSDIVLAWPLLVPGGIMILDDYGWGSGRPAPQTPKPAIDAFLACHTGQYRLLETGYQVIVQKL